MAEMKLVPVEPTEAMVAAAYRVTGDGLAITRKALVAAIAASPQAPAREGEQRFVSIEVERMESCLSDLRPADNKNTGAATAYNYLLSMTRVAALTPREEAPANTGACRCGLKADDCHPDCPHGSEEAPAEGAGERVKSAAELQDELDHLANQYGDLLSEVEALRARTSEPEAVEAVAWRYRWKPTPRSEPGDWREPTHSRWSVQDRACFEEQPLYDHPSPATADKLRELDAFNVGVEAMCCRTKSAYDNLAAAGLKADRATHPQYDMALDELDKIVFAGRTMQRSKSARHKWEQEALDTLSPKEADK